MSQLLLRLEHELQLTRDPDHRAELVARKAGYYARIGRFEEARQQVDELRKTYGDGRSGRVTVWIMLAEGLIHLFEEMSPKAMDRFARALALGVAMKYPTVVSLAGAWKAHMEFQSGDFGSMIRSLNLSASHASPGDLDSTTRRAMVLCNCFTVCGDRPEAQRWFMRARDAALQNGDQASVEALVYNRAAFLSTWLRAENCIEPISPEDLKDVRMEIASARNFQDMTGNAAMTVHIHLWDARLQMLDGSYQDAIRRFRSIRGQLPVNEYNISQPYVDFEICYCLAQDGNIQEALSLQAKQLPLDMQGLDVDEQLVAIWMRLAMAALDPRFGEIELLKQELEHLRARYRASKADLIDRLTHLQASTS